MKNLSNFAKVRNKRSDSCPSIPSPPLQKVRGIPKENMNHNSVSDRVSITTTTTTTSSSDENDQVSTTQRQDHLPGQQTPETSSPSILTHSPFEQVLKQESTTTHTIEGGTLAATHSNRKDEPHSKEGKTIVEPNTCQEKSNNHRPLSIKERAKQNMLKRLNM
ncbi:hypothetical protein C9374_002717 [Naegleria lovaniensis]|uniref:Uncharacterized protein n=1 Tax=Naegleria lovaniensis TaxID=51637 RepID=A0AA88GUX3_NAELO|nr:uncharacterized protein C9374_002717 [Naegleria lovaniensis]KAG2386271.1 hypothetical protein C9374_002717 [Naegleria lovaniensis]